MNIIEKIIAHKKKELAQQKNLPDQASLKKSLGKSFLKALKKPVDQLMPNVIAEIKKASPSKGHILKDGDIPQIAKTYETSGASAISILTDKNFFMGSLNDIKSINKKVSTPILRKDFIFTEAQISEAAHVNTSAVLLMVTTMRVVFGERNALDNLKKLINYTHSLAMDALVETHSAAEIDIAVKAGAKIIGVNSRDFDDLSIDLSIFPRLLPLIPDHIVKVAESGIYTREDIVPFAHLCDAILVGSSLMESGTEGIPTKITELKTL